MANRKFVATVNIKIQRLDTLPGGQIACSQVRVIEATGEASAAQASVEAAFADGIEEFVSQLPQQDGPLVVAPTEGH